MKGKERNFIYYKCLVVQALNTNWGYCRLKINNSRKSSQNLMLVFEERGKTEYPEKNISQCREENQQTHPHDAESGNRTQATMVGGECSHHCAIPALHRSVCESKFKIIHFRGVKESHLV